MCVYGITHVNPTIKIKLNQHVKQKLKMLPFEIESKHNQTLHSPDYASLSLLSKSVSEQKEIEEWCLGPSKRQKQSTKKKKKSCGVEQLKSTYALATKLKIIKILKSTTS